MGDPHFTEAEDFYYAARELGLNIPFEECQRKIIENKGKAAAAGLTLAEWERQNLLRFLLSDEEQD